MNDEKKFGKFANSVLKRRKKAKIGKPNKKQMEKEFRSGWEEWHKKHPDKNEWDYAREFMKRKLVV